MNAATEQAALLAAVIAEPDQDAPRLVYADWLEENGQGERSEFIRVQCHLADPEANTRRFDALRRRERALLGRHEGEWLDWLKDAWDAEWVPVRDCSLTWRRGFVEAVRCALPDWLAHGRAIVQAQPVTRVETNDQEPDCVPSVWRDPVHVWYWDGSTPHHVPTDVFDLLPPGDVPGFSSHAIYSTHEKAVAALSAALLAWAHAAAPPAP